MVNLVQSLKVGDISYTIKDSNTIPGLTAGQKSVLLASGTYLDKAVVDGKVFETDAGKFERFNKTVTGATLGSSWSVHDMGVTFTGSQTSFIAYGAGVFVMFDTEGYGFYSTDGINWKPSQVPVHKNYEAITFAEGLFVACSQDGQTSLASSDGINWIKGSAGSIAGTKTIVYANGYYYIISTSTVRKSVDGVNWESAPTIPFSGGTYLYSAYGNGVLTVLVNSTTTGGYQGAYMKDGESSWTSFAHPVNVRGLAYGDGKFVAAATSGGSAYHSTDGINWTRATLPANSYWGSVVFGEGIFVVMRNNWGTPQAYSVDGGVTWQSTTMPGGAWYWCAYGDGKFVSVHLQATKVAINNLDITYQYSTTPLSYTAAEVDAMVAQATITEDKVDVSTGTLVL